MVLNQMSKADLKRNQPVRRAVDPSRQAFLRRIMTFRKVTYLLAFWGLVGILHFIPHARYPVTGVAGVPYEGHGLAFTTMPPKTVPRVILLGNSALVQTQTIPFLETLREQTGRNYEIGNFSITSATIADDIITYNYIKRFHPDLVIVQLHPFTFGWAYPLYHHTSRKMIFQPGMRALWRRDILDTLTPKDWAEGILYSYLPFYQALPVWRAAVHRWVRDRLPAKAAPLMDFFTDPLAGPDNWRLTKVEKKVGQALQFAEAPRLLTFFIDQLERDRQPTVFILQATSNESLPIIGELPAFFEGKTYCRIYDFRKFYNESQYIDSVHPDDTGALQAARRLYQVIDRHLPER